MSKSLISSFLVSHVSESLKSNERCEWIAHFALKKWAIRSEEMSDCEQMAQVAHQKWANCSFFFCETLIRSFLDKKLAIRLEIKWANSQSCVIICLVAKRTFFHYS